MNNVPRCPRLLTILHSSSQVQSPPSLPATSKRFCQHRDQRRRINSFWNEFELGTTSVPTSPASSEAPMRLAEATTECCCEAYLRSSPSLSRAIRSGGDGRRRGRIERSSGPDVRRASCAGVRGEARRTTRQSWLAHGRCDRAGSDLACLPPHRHRARAHRPGRDRLHAARAGVRTRGRTAW